MIAVFFALLFLLLGMTYRAGLTVLFWSLLGFIVVASVFVFYQYVHEYEQTHGKGTWVFDPLALIRRGRTTRVGQLRQNDAHRVRRIMRALDYTEGEIDAHIALLEENADTNPNELLLIEDAIDEARRRRGALTADEKAALLRRFQDGVSSQAKQTPPSPTPAAQPPPSQAAQPQPSQGEAAKKGKKGKAQPPAQPPAPMCNVAKGSADLAELDYHLFRPRRAASVDNECAKCVLAEFDGMSPESIVPKTPLEYTKMLLGDKQTAIDGIVEAAQAKCFAKAGADKAKAVAILTRTFDVYFFGNSSPTLPQAAQEYLLYLYKNPPAVRPNDGKGRCVPNAAEMRQQQDDMTGAVHALYRTYKLAVDDARAGGKGGGGGGKTLEDLFARKSGFAPSASGSSVTFNPLDYAPVGAPAAPPPPAADADASAYDFDAAALERSIGKMLDSTGDESCRRCVGRLAVEMRNETRSDNFFRISRGLRHNPILKTTFLVQFMQVYFRHYAEICATNDKENANLNMTIYARKLLAMTQLWWAVILQSVYADL